MRSLIMRALSIAALACALAATASAHDKSKALTPQHGGILIEVDHHAVEMVLKPESITFHVTEHGEPIDVTGASFKAVVQTPAGTSMLELKAEATTLSSALDAPLPTGTKIALTGKDKAGDVIQARFVTK